MHNLSTFGIIVLVQLLSLHGDADLAGSLLSAPVAVSACKVVTSESGLCKLVSCTDTGNVAGCTHGLYEASVSAGHKRRRDALKRCVVHFFGFCADDGLAATIVLATEPFGATLSAALPPKRTHHAVIEDAR